MKIRYLFIILLAVMMVFAFSSCKEDPKTKVEPQDPEQVIEDDSIFEQFPWGNTYVPTDNDVYEIIVETGVDGGYYSNDKLKIIFNQEVHSGDMLSLKYRSERSIYQWDIRDGSLKWVYESQTNGFDEPVLGEGGWYTLTYTFGNDISGVEVASNSKFGVYFRGNFVEEDVFEIMDATLTRPVEEGDPEVIPLVLDDSSIASAAALSEEPIKDHVWDKPRTFAVLVATGQPGDEDSNPFAFKVEAGGTSEAIFAELKKQGITKVYSDAALTERFYKSWKALEDGFILYYENK